MPDPTSTGMRTEVLSPLSDEVRLILPQPDVKGTTAAKHPEFGSKHSLRGRYPDHVLVDIRPSGSSGYVDYIYEVLPTTPRVIEEIDPDKGVVYKHVYRDQLASTLPAKGATELLGTDLDAGRYVYRAVETPIGGTLAEVTVVTVLPPGTLKTTSLTDEIHGPMKKYEQFVRIADSSLPAKGTEYPAGSGRLVLSARLVDEDGTFATREIITVLLADVPIRWSKATDNEWGAVDKWEKWGLSNRSIPAIGDANTIGTGTVLSSQLRDDDGVFADLSITTQANAARIGVPKSGSEIDQIFCVSATVTQEVPDSINMEAYARGNYVTVGTKTGYVLDAQLRGKDSNTSTLTVKLTATNQVTVSETKIDMETGLPFQETQIYVLTASPLVGYGVQGTGTYAETKKIGCNFWVHTTSKTTTLTTESYDIIAPASWPAVLLDYRIDPLYYTDGETVARYFFDYRLKKAYNGPCRARVTRTWTKTAPTVASPTLLIPEEIHYDGIFLQVSIPPCLHSQVSFTENTGTNHPKYKYTVKTKTFAATNRTTWPASMLYDVNVDRHKGGYIKEEITVYSPT